MVIPLNCFSPKNSLRSINSKTVFYLINALNGVVYFFITPFNNDSTKSTINIKKIILAIPAAAPAMPPNPRMAAMIAIITNVIVQRNIIYGFS